MLTIGRQRVMILLNVLSAIVFCVCWKVVRYLYPYVLCKCGTESRQWIPNHKEGTIDIGKQVLQTPTSKVMCWVLKVETQQPQVATSNQPNHLGGQVRHTHFEKGHGGNLMGLYPTTHVEWLHLNGTYGGKKNVRPGSPPPPPRYWKRLVPFFNQLWLPLQTCSSMNVHSMLNQC